MEVAVQTVLNGQHWDLRGQKKDGEEPKPLALDDRGNNPVYVDKTRGRTLVKHRFDYGRFRRDRVTRVSPYDGVEKAALKLEGLGVSLLNPGDKGRFTLTVGLKEEVDGEWTVLDGNNSPLAPYFENSEKGVERFVCHVGQVMKVICVKGGRRRTTRLQLIFRQAKDEQKNPTGKPELWLRGYESGSLPRTNQAGDVEIGTPVLPVEMTAKIRNGVKPNREEFRARRSEETAEGQE